jgi:hypothetical protein
MTIYVGFLYSLITFIAPRYFYETVHSTSKLYYMTFKRAKVSAICGNVD